MWVEEVGDDEKEGKEKEKNRVEHWHWIGKVIMMVGFLEWRVICTTYELL